ncbi:ATP-binding protein [Salinibaculum rarum]|uniref:ATP-binding protein n=1 Tax=Salinibaculum rarum TaxID=3058903 RepID=UPI00265E296D|nr:ATP-binding protein [Salinibaculum sp. KK48]
MPDSPDPSKFEEHGHEIEQRIENTLQRVIDDYPTHWKGVLSEAIQNAYDAWCHNRFERGVIPESAPLKITFDIDTSANELTVTDNAGGMPESTFTTEFIGLDTPGEEKQDGGYGGSYGRGTHVVGGLSEDHLFYAETRHQGWNGALWVRLGQQIDDTVEVGLGTPGTTLEVKHCKPDVLADLADWSEVEAYLQDRFHGLLHHDNVTIEYTIDGETRTPAPFPINDFTIIEQGDFEFDYDGETYTLRNLRVYDADTADAEVPWTGISMMKSNKHVDQPFMRVQDYIPLSVTKRDAFFAVCDASDLCPEYENNAHNQFQSDIPSNTPLRGFLEEVEQEHFIGGPADLNEQDEIEERSLALVNEIWDSTGLTGDSDVALGGTGTGNLLDPSTGEDETEMRGDGGTTTDTQTTGPGPTSPPEPGPGGGDGLLTNRPGDDEDDATGDDDNDTDDAQEEISDVQDILDEYAPERESPTLRTSLNSSTHVVDDVVKVWTSVENPTGSDVTDFHIEGVLRDVKTGEEVMLGERTVAVAEGKRDAGRKSWTHTLTESGDYEIAATLTGPDGDVFDERVEPFVVDDPDTSNNDASSDDADEETPDDDPEPVRFLEEIMPTNDHEDKYTRYQITTGEKGVRIRINELHPEYVEAQRNDRDDTERVRLISRWALEGMAHRVLTNFVRRKLGDEYTEDGQPMSEVVNKFLITEIVPAMDEMLYRTYATDDDDTLELEDSN